MNVAFVRGAYLNNFEAQNYVFRDAGIEMTAISSLFPLHRDVPFKRIGLFSPADIHLPSFVANRTIGDRQMLFGLEKVAGRFEIVHSADPHYYYSYQLARMRANGTIKKLLLTSWETIPHNNESAAAKRQIKYYSMRYADAFLCYSQRAANCLKSEGVSPRRIYTVALGVDIDRFAPSKSAKSRPLTILFVGRLVEEKGVFDLLRAFYNLADKTVQLIIIGTGPLHNALTFFVKKNFLSSRVFIKPVRYENMHTVYQNADIAVFPSKTTRTWEEQYGMALIEAMACGLPIIANQTGSIGSIVGDTALLVHEDSTKALTAAIAHLAQSVALRHKLGTMSRRHYE